MKPKRINAWGMASIVALSFGFLSDWIYPESPEHFEIKRFALCFIPQLAALICGFLAAMRGSGRWLVVVMLSAIQALVCITGSLVGDF